ncbi:hypothetical protein WSM22_44100 [Cytophagales bacterium WSM2-2]|nr:hypothetical protein WSM22_44100 [Cytophagales bacterium WSM2-2]
MSVIVDEDMSRLRGLINLMFYLILEKADDKAVAIAYRRFVELEQNEEVRIKLLIAEAKQHYSKQLIELIAKLSIIDSEIGRSATKPM